MNCPSCNSDNTQRLEVVFEQGTNHINTTSSTNVRPAFGAISTAKATTSTSGVSMSKSAQKAAPPPKKGYKVPAIGVIVGLVVVFATLQPFNVLWFIIGLVIACGAGYLLFSAFKYNMKSWPDAYQVWQKSWMCNKCGSIFVEN